jgi:hypothetical protein
MSTMYGFEGTDIDRASGGKVDITFFEDDEKGGVKHFVTKVMSQDEFEWFVDCVYEETMWERATT